MSHSFAAPERILLVRLSHLGDVIQALPVIHAVARAFPDAELAFATQAAYAPLLAPLPELARVITFDREGGPAAWWHFRRAARAFAPTWTIDCQGNWKSAWAAWLSGAKRRSGLAVAHWRERSARILANDFATDPSALGVKVAHAVDRQRNLARYVTSAADVPAAFELALGAEERAAGSALLGDAQRPALLHLAKPGDPRSWPAESFLALAQALAAHWRATFLLAGPDEQGLRPLLEAIAPAPNLRVLATTPDLRTLAALFAVAAERGGLLVGCDSGPSNLAAATGLPVVHLHGPQNPARTGPYPPEAHVHMTAARALDCRPCLARVCARPEGPVCLSDLRVDEVLEAVMRAGDERPSSRRGLGSVWD